MMILEELAFFLHIKKQSVGKKCVRCKKKVRLQPSIVICASCTSALEYGQRYSLLLILLGLRPRCDDAVALARGSIYPATDQ